MRKILRSVFRPYDAGCGFVASADLLRVLCVYVVAWYHIWQQSWLNPVLEIGSLRLDFNPIVRTGYLMVDLLLLLSGFLLFLPYAKCRLDHQPFPKIGLFYRKRAARILPSYLFCILIILFCFALPKGQYATTRHLWTDIWRHLTFTHNYDVLSYHNTRLNTALWTLAVEVQFYLIAPFVCRAFRKQPAVTYGVMLLITALWRYFFVYPLSDTTYALNQLPNLLEVYANGMLAAHLYGELSRRGRQKPWQAWLSTLAAIVCLWALWMLTEDQGHVSGYEEVRLGQMNRRFLFSACGAAFLLFGSRSIRLFRSLCSNRAVRFLSGISLNFYIWHQVLAVKLKQWRIPPYVNENPHMAGEQLWQIQYTILCFAAALLAGILVTYLIEKPAAKLILRKKRTN